MAAKPDSKVEIKGDAKDAKVEAKDAKDAKSASEVHFVSQYACVLGIIRGRNLPGMDIGGKSDPYIKADLDGHKFQTPVCSNTVNPEWNEQYQLVLDKPPQLLKLECWDYDKASSDDKMGSLRVDLTRYRGNTNLNQYISLNEAKTGEILVYFACNEIQKAVRNKESFGSLDGVDLSQLTYLLDMEVVGARRLVHTGMFGSGKFFAKVQLAHSSYHTAAKPEAMPVWNMSCPLWIGKGDPVVTISVHDGTKESNTTLGQVFIRPSFFALHKTVNVWLPLKATTPSTDAELSQMMANMALDVAANAADDGKTPAVHITLTKRPKAEVEQQFYTSIIDAYDADKNGAIDLEELIHMCNTIGSTCSNKEIEEAFRAADKNKSGLLNRDELYNLLAHSRFQSADVTRRLHAYMQYGKDGLSRLAMRGCFVADGDEFKDESGKQVENVIENVLIFDRASGLIVQENIPSYIKSGMRLLYRSSTPSAAVTGIFRKMTNSQGDKMNQPSTAADIPAFIELHKLNVNEVLLPLNQFKNFNEFFYRKLAPGARLPAAPADPTVAVSPADCRLMVFPTIADAQKLWIKGANFSIPNLLTKAADPDGALSRKFLGGSMVIARLAPQDYHRWHTPCDGVLQPRKMIQGEYYTVNPIAIRKNIDVYTTNKRCIMPIESKEFGTVCMIAVGATMVGSMAFCCPRDNFNDCKKADGTCCAGAAVKKFDEHGYFAFGGSTVLLLFQPGAILFDADLVQNSSNKLETLVKVGASLGKAVGKFQK